MSHHTDVYIYGLSAVVSQSTTHINVVKKYYEIFIDLLIVCFLTCNGEYFLDIQDENKINCRENQRGNQKLTLYKNIQK